MNKHSRRQLKTKTRRWTEWRGTPAHRRGELLYLLLIDLPRKGARLKARMRTAQPGSRHREINE